RQQRRRAHRRGRAHPAGPRRGRCRRPARPGPGRHRSGARVAPRSRRGRPGGRPRRTKNERASMSASHPPVRRYRPPAPLGGRRHASGGLARRNAGAFAFLAPALIVIGLFVIWPMVSALRLSFTDASGFGREEWVGLENYVTVFTDPDILNAVVNTVQYTVLFTPAAVLAALGPALLLVNPHRPFRSFFRTALFVPFVISFAVAAFAWSYLIDPQVGLLNHWLGGLGIRMGNVLQDPTL